MARRPRGAWADKAWRDALRLAVMRPANEPNPKPKTKLDELAFTLIETGKSGDVPALKEIGDRLDGKVPQAHVGGDPDSQPIRVTRIELVDLA
jgi:hypothetical protein